MQKAKKGRLRLLAVIPVAAGLLTSAALAALTVDISWLTSDSAADRNASVSRGWVAWQGGMPAGIYLWQQGGAAPRRISTTRGTNQNPHNYEDRVVWECGFDPDAEICYFDGQRARRITRDGLPDEDPQVWGSAVVWVRADRYLMLYNARTRRSRVLMDYGGANFLPESTYALRDNRAKQSGADDQRVVVAYAGVADNGDPDGLFLYDDNTGGTTRIAEGMIVHPALAGQIVAFSRFMRAGDNSSQEIWYYNARTARLTRVTNNRLQDNYPAVSGRYLVWHENHGYGDGAIKVLDLQTGRQRQVVRNAAVWQITPHAASQIVWWWDSEGVHVFEPASGKLTTLSEEGTGADSDGELIAWEDYNSGSGGNDIAIGIVR